MEQPSVQAPPAIRPPILSKHGELVSAPLQKPGITPNGINKVSYTHDAMCDLIIANPAITKQQIAAHFGYSRPWVSRILWSDAFQMRLAVRKADLVDPTLLMTINEKLNALLSESLDILIEKVSTLQSVDTAMKAVEITTKALGYGARQQNVTVQQSFVVAMPTPIPDQSTWAQKYGGPAEALDVSSRTLDERLVETEEAKQARAVE